MRPVELDFAQAAPLPRRQALAVLLAGLLVLAAVLAWLGTLKAELATLRQAVADGQQGAQRSRLAAPATVVDEAERQELARAQQVAMSLNRRWAVLFRQLEAVRVPGVTLLAVQPEAGSGQRWRVAGVGRRYEDVLAFVRQLAAAPGFAGVHLVSHELVQAEGREAVHFTALAQWAAEP